MKKINYENIVASIVEAAKKGDDEKIKELALDLTDRNKGGDSILAFYGLIEVVKRLGKEYRNRGIKNRRT